MHAKATNRGGFFWSASNALAHENRFKISVTVNRKTRLHTLPTFLSDVGIQSPHRCNIHRHGASLWRDRTESVATEICPIETYFTPPRKKRALFSLFGGRPSDCVLLLHLEERVGIHGWRREVWGRPGDRGSGLVGAGRGVGGGSYNPPSYFSFTLA